MFSFNEENFININKVNNQTKEEILNMILEAISSFSDTNSENKNTTDFRIITISKINDELLKLDNLIDKNHFENALKQCEKIIQELIALSNDLQELVDAQNKKDEKCKKIILHSMDFIQKEQLLNIEKINEIFEEIIQNCNNEKIKNKIQNFDLNQIPLESNIRLIIFNFLESLLKTV